MPPRSIQRFALGFHALVMAALAFAVYRTEIIRTSPPEVMAFPAGFAERFEPLIGHGPDARWGGCWLSRVESAVDTTTFSFSCPGERDIDIEARLTETQIWKSCPYLLTTAENGALFEPLSESLCAALPLRPDAKACCGRSRRQSTRLLPPVSLRQDALSVQN